MILWVLINVDAQLDAYINDGTLPILRNKVFSKPLHNLKGYFWSAVYHNALVRLDNRSSTLAPHGLRRVLRHSASSKVEINH